MINLCGACQRPLRGNMGLCCDCTKTYGVLGDDGKLAPRDTWPAWLRYAMADEQRRRRSERMAEDRCAPLEVALLRDSAE